MKRVAAAVAAVLTLVLLLLGVPWLLVCWGRVTDLVTVDWRTALLRPDDGRITLGLLSLVGWLAWALLALTTAGELLRTVSQGRIRFSLPGTSWLRPAVALLVATALSPLFAANATPLPDGAPMAIAAPAEAQPSAPGELAPQDGQQESGSWREYEVRQGDELWDIAERELGAGERWRQLVAANPGVDIDHPPAPGRVLRLPLTITVERGDSLWQLADRHLGDPERWPELQDANQDQIQDPDEIDQGWVLTLPGADIAAAKNFA